MIDCRWLINGRFRRAFAKTDPGFSTTRLVEGRALAAIGPFSRAARHRAGRRLCSAAARRPRSARGMDRRTGSRDRPTPDRGARPVRPRNVGAARRRALARVQVERGDDATRERAHDALAAATGERLQRPRVVGAALHLVRARVRRVRGADVGGLSVRIGECGRRWPRTRVHFGPPPLAQTARAPHPIGGSVEGAVDSNPCPLQSGHAPHGAPHFSLVRFISLSTWFSIVRRLAQPIALPFSCFCFLPSSSRNAFLDSSSASFSIPGIAASVAHSAVLPFFPLRQDSIHASMFRRATSA